MTMTVDAAISEREHRKYEAWSEYVEAVEGGIAINGVKYAKPEDYFTWLDSMGLE